MNYIAIREKTHYARFSFSFAIFQRAMRGAPCLLSMFFRCRHQLPIFSFRDGYRFDIIFVYFSYAASEDFRRCFSDIIRLAFFADADTPFLFDASAIEQRS